MKKQIRDLEQRLRQLLIEPLQKTSGAPQEPLDLWTAIEQRLREHLTLNLAKKQIFPARHIVITVPVRDAAERSRFEGAFAEDLLRQEVLRFLAEEGATAPVDLWLTVHFLLGEGQFSVATDNQRNPVAVPLAAAPAQNAEARLRVLSGESPIAQLTLGRHRTTIGRGEKIRDGENNTARRNDLFFADVRNGINEKVSRRHARLEYDETNQAYRLYRDQPGADLSVRRGSRTIDDIPLSGLGLLLQPGDVIRLGRAEVEYTESAGEWDE
jgi:hypothetical protein